MARAGFAGLASLVLGVLGCGPSTPPAPPPPPTTPLHLEPACDLAPSAGLSWIVDAKPRTIAETPDLIPAIATVIPEDRFRAFSATHGGIDLRQVQSLCVAKYGESILTVAQVPLDPTRVATAFAERSAREPQRARVVANPPVLRLSGDLSGSPAALLLFGREAVAYELGPAAPTGGAAPKTPPLLRVAEAFALGKLKRAQPALRGAAIARTAELVGVAPVRFFVPGPFEGESARGLGGLLRATTAVGIGARFEGPPARLAVRLVLAGAWGEDAPAAAERLAAAVHVVAESGPGHLLHIDHMPAGPFARGEPDALILDATIDGAALARGLHDALDAEVADIMNVLRR